MCARSEVTQGNDNATTSNKQMNAKDLSEEDVHASLDHGATLDVNTVVQEILGDRLSNWE